MISVDRELTRQTTPHYIYKCFSFSLVVAYCVGIPLLAQAYWPLLIQYMKHNDISKAQLYLVFTMAQHCLTMVLGNLIYFTIYSLGLPFFDQYKAIKEPWLWQTDPLKWQKLLKSSIKMTVLNTVVLFILLNAKILVKEIDQRIEVEDIPGPLKFTLTIIFCMLCDDFAFHWAHKFLHRPFWYKHVHKLHHEHTMSVSIAAINTHPVEFVLGNLAPLFLGPLLLGKHLHMVSWWGFVQYSLCETIEDHSGYEFPWNPFYMLPF